MTIMEYKCTECGFEFRDDSLIFYIENDKLVETSLTLESSKKMNESELMGYLYIGYCNSCDNYIKTYVPELKGEFNEKEVVNKINNLIDTSNNDTKILIFDFDETSFQSRRNVLCDNICPKCENTMCLLIDEFHPCPKCGKDNIIDINE